MNTTVQTTQKAIQLRRLGFSYSDIARELKVSRTSVCNWVRNVRLTEHEKQVLEKSIANKMHRAHMKASISLRSRKIFKEKKAFESAEKNFKKNLRDPLFSTGLGLYSSKGSFKGGFVHFIHPDPSIISIISQWMEKYLGVEKKDIKHYKTKENKGSFVISVGKIDALRTVIAWQKLLIRYYS